MKRFPPLPRVVDAPGGPVTVRFGLALKDDEGKAALGHYEDRPRLITIDASEPRRHQWLILFHELAHVAIRDSGVGHALTDTVEEILCDAIATARMRERFG